MCMVVQIEEPVADIGSKDAWLHVKGQQARSFARPVFEVKVPYLTLSYQMCLP